MGRATAETRRPVERSRPGVSTGEVRFRVPSRVECGWSSTVWRPDANRSKPRPSGTATPSWRPQGRHPRFPLQLPEKIEDAGLRRHDGKAPAEASIFSWAGIVRRRLRRSARSSSCPSCLRGGNRGSACAVDLSDQVRSGGYGALVYVRDFSPRRHEGHEEASESRVLGANQNCAIESTLDR